MLPRLLLLFLPLLASAAPALERREADENEQKVFSTVAAGLADIVADNSNSTFNDRCIVAMGVPFYGAWGSLMGVWDKNHKQVNPSIQPDFDKFTPALSKPYSIGKYSGTFTATISIANWKDPEQIAISSVSNSFRMTGASNTNELDMSFCVKYTRPNAGLDPKDYPNAKDYAYVKCWFEC